MGVQVPSAKGAPPGAPARAPAAAAPGGGERPSVSEAAQCRAAPPGGDARSRLESGGPGGGGGAGGANLRLRAGDPGPGRGRGACRLHGNTSSSPPGAERARPGGLTPPARPPPQPFATGTGCEGAGRPAERLTRRPPRGAPYANIIVCICKYANAPAPVRVAGGEEREGVGKGAEGYEEFGDLGAEQREAAWGGPWGRAGRVWSPMADGGGPARQSGDAPLPAVCQAWGWHRLARLAAGARAPSAAGGGRAEAQLGWGRGGPGRPRPPSWPKAEARWGWGSAGNSRSRALDWPGRLGAAAP